MQLFKMQMDNLQLTQINFSRCRCISTNSTDIFLRCRYISTNDTIINCKEQAWLNEWREEGCHEDDVMNLMDTIKMLFVYSWELLKQKFTFNLEKIYK